MDKLKAIAMETIAIYDVQDYEVKAFKKEFAGHTLKLFSEPLTEKNALSTATIISGFIHSSFSKQVLQKFPKLKLISLRSTGFDHVDVEYCKSKKIAVYNVPFYGENTIAEHAFALILALSRKIVESNTRAKKMNFSTSGLTGLDLKGKTIGIIGGGHIGMHVARIAKGFGMHVRVFDVHEQHFFSELVGFRYVPLKDLLQQSDIISMHAPYNEHTHHLINKNNIKFVKKGTMFVNTARGGLVDSKVLLKALKDGTLSCAGLDVLEGEAVLTNQAFKQSHNKEFESALKQNKEFAKLDNVLLTPHNAFNSVEALQRILETSIVNVKQGLKGNSENKVC